MDVAAPACGSVRRCEHRTGRSAYPKPTRSRSVQPSSSTFGACAPQRRRLFGTSRPPLPARNRTFSDGFASRWLRLLAPYSRIGPAKVLCRVPERSHYHVDRTLAPHGNKRSPSPGPALPPFGRADTSGLQHCLVDVSQHSTKPWATARRVKHVPRVKYGGILAVAYDEHRRLVIERTIAKWRNSALRYHAIRKWRCASARLRKRSEACGPSAAGRLPRGCSTCASDTGSARCERWSRLVESNRSVYASVLPPVSVVADGAVVRKGAHTPPTTPCGPKLA